MAVTEEQREELQRLQSSSEVVDLRRKLQEAESKLDEAYTQGQDLHCAFEKKCDETAEFAGKAASASTYLAVEVERSKELEARVEQYADQQAEMEKSYTAVLRKNGKTVEDMVARSYELQRMGVEDCRSYAVRR